MLRRTAIRKTSKKRAAENRVRAQVLRQIAEECGYECQVRLPGMCTGHAADGHELLRRSQGGSIVDPANILLVCRPCHMWITGHPFEASVLGLSKWSWEDEAA